MSLYLLVSAPRFNALGAKVHEPSLDVLGISGLWY
jgi:hypothetical protein